MKRTTVISLAIVLAGCASSKILLTDTEKADYKYGKTKFDRYTKEAFLEGKTITASSCIKCHKLKNPADFTEDKLNKVIPNMANRAKLSKEQADLVLKYYIASGKKAG